MKYAKEIYEQFEFYAPDEEVLNHTQRVVKARKEHKCCQCQKDIKVGENALCEKGFIDGQPHSAYTCIECCDKWIDDIEEEAGAGE